MTQQTAAGQIEATTFRGEVSTAWLAQDGRGQWLYGAWLAEAAESFGDDYLKRDCRAAADRFAALGDGETVETFALHSDHAGLAADRDLKNRLSGEQKAAWTLYCGLRGCLQIALKARLTFGSLAAFGQPTHAGADFEWIPWETWHYLRIDPDQRNVVRGEGVVYFYVRVVDPMLSPPGAEPPGATTKRVGGKNYAARDQPLIEEMRRMLTADPPGADSPWDATRYVLSRAAGNSTEDAKRRRLLLRYSDVFRAERN